MPRYKEDDLILCPRCGAFAMPDVTDAKPPHYKKLNCPDCNHPLGFLAKPENEKKLDHRPNGQPSASQVMESKGIDYCEICLRRKNQLGSRGFFEVHHISKDPADNRISNLLLTCKACHQFIHYLQVYLNDHMKEFCGIEDVNA
jgi:uncharacterized protein YbaR (Trm112 family)